MTQEQINRKEMHDAVITFLDNNLQKWISIPKVGEFKNELVNVNSQIEQAQEDQQKAKVFVGKTKKQLKKTIADKADIINDQLESYAVVIGNTELENRMAKSFTDLYRLKNINFNVAIKEVVTEAQKHKEVLLTEYGMTEAQIVDLQTDFNAFLTMQGLPRAYEIASSQATKSLKVLFSETEKILKKKLDKAMKIFKRRDTNFYNGYLAARVIVDD